jgi:hypothetical protein
MKPLHVILLLFYDIKYSHLEVLPFAVYGIVDTFHDVETFETSAA